MTPKSVAGVGADALRVQESAGAGSPAAGLICGARVLTSRGEKSVASLRAGQMLVTRDAGPARIKRIEITSLVTHLIYIIAGSIGHHRLDRDAMLVAHQTVRLEDWRAQAMFAKSSALVCAQTLVDGEYVRNLGQYPVTAYRIYCDAPQVIFADGLTLGTADTVVCTPQVTLPTSR